MEKKFWCWPNTVGETLILRRNFTDVSDASSQRRSTNLSSNPSIFVHEKKKKLFLGYRTDLTVGMTHVPGTFWFLKNWRWLLAQINFESWNFT